MKLVPISREAHSAKRVRSRASFEAFRQSGLIPLYGAELAKAAHEFPICFTRDPDGFFPAALTAVEPQKNLYVAVDGQWLAGYLPAVMRRAPFALARVEQTGNWVLCLDEENELVSDMDGNPLFAEDGTPAPLIGEMSNFLAELERNRVATIAACAALAEHGLLEPWDLKVQAEDGTTKRLEGLYSIPEPKLAAVSAEGLAALRDSGALTIAYAHLFSLAKLPVLGRLATIQAQFAAQARPPVQQPAVDLDHAFGIVGDEPFQFDFK